MTTVPKSNSQCWLVSLFFGFQSKGPFWEVPLGRRDGTVSIDTESLDALPPPTGNITELTQLFAAVNLDIKDLVVLSAAHTIGTSHCFSFSDRLYNFKIGRAHF